MKFSMYSGSTAKVHNKLKTACLDKARFLVYSSDTEKGIVHAFSIQKKQSCGHIKMSNARVNKMVCDSDLHRLYATTRNGIFLIFDI